MKFVTIAVIAALILSMLWLILALWLASFIMTG